MGKIGWTEILLILAVVLVLFGAKRLPEIARSFGKSIQEFKKGVSDKDNTDSDTTNTLQG
jgi:sec-independent protein translocase protein TatA